MKKAIIGLIVSVCLFMATACPALEIGPDKVFHAGGCTVLSMAANSTLKHVYPDMPGWERAVWSILATVAVGCAKELTDSEVDNGDLVADGVGAVCGSLITISW